jgi:acyl carrier protein
MKQGQDAQSRRLSAARAAGAVGEERKDAVIHYLQNLVADRLGKAASEIPADWDFLRLGLDSITLMELVVRVTEDFQLPLYPQELFERPSIASLADYLAGEWARHAAPVETAALEDVGKTVSDVFASAEPQAGPPGARNASVAMILSSPRAGSTLLRVMLAGHPDLFCPPELHLLPFHTMGERAQKLERSYLGEGLERAVMMLRNLDAAGARHLVDAWVAEDLSTQEVYANLQRHAAPRLLVDKSPSYAWSTGNLERAQGLFENPKFIALVRHPYAVIESIVRNRFDRLLGAEGVDPAAFGEVIWTTINRNILAFLKMLPAANCCLVRYEDLVADPQETLEDICALLGVGFHAALLTPYQGDRMTDGVHSQSWGIGDPTFLRHDHIDASLGACWREIRLPRPLSFETIETAAALGYELPVEGSQPAVRADHDIEEGRL